MSKYSELELPALMEMLIKHTEEYTKMVSFKVFSVEEFAQCKQQLAEIHSAIQEKTGKEAGPVNNILPNFPENSPGESSPDSSNHHRHSRNP